MKITNQQFQNTISRMPLLRHSFPGRPFNVEESEVVKWIMAQPGFHQWVFDRLANSERIEYVPSERAWHGVPRGKPGRPPSGKKYVCPVLDPEPEESTAPETLEID